MRKIRKIGRVGRVRLLCKSVKFDSNLVMTRRRALEWVLNACLVFIKHELRYMTLWTSPKHHTKMVNMIWITGLFMLNSFSILRIPQWFIACNNFLNAYSNTIEFICQYIWSNTLGLRTPNGYLGFERKYFGCLDRLSVPNQNAKVIKICHIHLLST